MGNYTVVDRINMPTVVFPACIFNRPLACPNQFQRRHPDGCTILAAGQVLSATDQVENTK